jgi:hypothetical protein
MDIFIHVGRLKSHQILSFKLKAPSLSFMFMHKPFSIQKQPTSIFAKLSTSIIGGEHKKSCEFLFLGGWVGIIQEREKVIQGIASS